MQLHVVFLNFGQLDMTYGNADSTQISKEVSASVPDQICFIFWVHG